VGTLYIDTGGATTNSGSTDQNAANLSGTNATVAGSVVTLDGSPDLSGLITSGATQSSIYLAQATNTNRKIFWVTAFDNALKTVTVDVAPTGITGSNWTIGGRFHLGATASPANASIEGALRAGDVAIFNNSPAPQAATIWTFRNAGNSTGGFAKITGKAGVRPVLNTTNTSNCVSTNVALSWIENFEIDQDGASGNGVNLGSSAVGAVLFNLKVVDAGSIGINVLNGGHRVIGCSVSGVGAEAVAQTSGIPNVTYGNYLRNGAGTNGITISGSNPLQFIVDNVIAAMVGRGIQVTSTGGLLCGVYRNTIYGCGNSGLEVTDAGTPMTVMNNIFMNNGNAAGESNVEWVAGTGERESFHGWGIFNNQSGADPPINFTLNSQVPASELTSDPLFVNAGAGNFALQAGSSALNAGSPGRFLGSLSTGYSALGAYQPVGVGAPPSGRKGTAMSIRIGIGIF